MKVGEQALGKIDKRVIKLFRETEEKNTTMDTMAVKLEKAKFARDEVARQQEDLKLSLHKLLP